MKLTSKYFDDSLGIHDGAEYHLKSFVYYVSLSRYPSDILRETYACAEIIHSSLRDACDVVFR